MKKIKIISWVVFLLVVAFTTTSLNQATKYQTLGNLVKQGLVTVKIEGNGGFSGKCIKMTLKNNSSKTLGVRIEAGRRLKSKNPKEQDIFITKSRKGTINGKESVSIIVKGYCCQSSNTGPSKKSAFTLGDMAPPKWLKLANFLDKNEFTRSAEQAAVWSISNNHPISSISSKTKWDVFPLREVVSKIKGEPNPWYFVEYVQDTSVFSNKPSSLSGLISYTLSTHSLVNILIKTEEGKLVKKMPVRLGRGAGKLVEHIEFDVLNWKKGNYKIEVYQDMTDLVGTHRFKL